MPPAAALECERTGWTLLRMATVAPASAAARAARWPARPAPMIRTSWLGMGAGILIHDLGRECGVGHEAREGGVPRGEALRRPAPRAPRPTAAPGGPDRSSRLRAGPRPDRR